MGEKIDKLIFYILVALVLCVLYWLFLDPVDQCLDRGGAWDEDRWGCVYLK